MAKDYCGGFSFQEYVVDCSLGQVAMLAECNMELLTEVPTRKFRAGEISVDSSKGWKRAE